MKSREEPVRVCEICGKVLTGVRLLEQVCEECLEASLIDEAENWEEADCGC